MCIRPRSGPAVIGNYREYEQSLLTERERVKRFIHIEWGADSHALATQRTQRRCYVRFPWAKERRTRLDYLKSGRGCSRIEDGDWSRPTRATLRGPEDTRKASYWLTGSAQWIFQGLCLALRPDDSIPNVNQKGVVERDLTKKESYFVFQSYWAESRWHTSTGTHGRFAGAKAGEERRRQGLLQLRACRAVS